MSTPFIVKLNRVYNRKFDEYVAEQFHYEVMICINKRMKEHSSIIIQSAYRDYKNRVNFHNLITDLLMERLMEESSKMVQKMYQRYKNRHKKSESNVFGSTNSTSSDGRAPPVERDMSHQETLAERIEDLSV